MILRSRFKQTDYDKDFLEGVVEKLLLSESRYLTANEICSLTGFPYSLYRTHGVEFCRIMDRLHLLGFRNAGNWPKDIREKQNEKLKNLYKSMIIEEGRAISLDRLSLETGIDRISLYRKFGGQSGVKKFHEDAGIPYVRGSYSVKRGDLVLYQEAVKSHGKYMTMSELEEVTGVPESFIIKEIISVVEFNKSLGFPRKNSAFEDRVYQLLCEAGVGVVECQKSFETLYSVGLKSRRKTKLRYDFYLPELRLLVEADGNQHSDPGSPFYSEDCQRKDRMKEEYALANGFQLLRLGYDLLIHMEDIKKALGPYKLVSTN